MTNEIERLGEREGGVMDYFLTFVSGAIIGCYVGWVATVYWERRYLADLIADFERQRREVNDLMRESRKQKGANNGLHACSHRF